MSIQIATKVLAKAALLDHRINPTTETVRAWAECFEGQKVWTIEALDSVRAHYSKQNPFPIMPGDVIAYCEKQPVWSSNEHAWWFLEKMSNYPYSDAIASYTGIRFPEIDPPAGQTLEQERAWLKETRRKWVHENRQTLIGAILSNRHNPQRELGA